MDQFIKSKMSISYINDQCPRDSVSLLYPINPQKPHFVSLSFKAIESYKMSSMVQKISVFRARLLGLDSPKSSIQDIMLKIFRFFEPMILQRFYKKTDIPAKHQIASLECLFPQDRTEDLANVLFFKKIDIKTIFESNENSTNSLALSEPTSDYTQNIQNLTLPGSIIKNGNPNPHQPTQIPEYFEDLLKYMRKCFNPDYLSVNLVPLTKVHTSQNYFMTSMKCIADKVNQTPQSKDSQSTKIDEEIPEELLIDPNPQKPVLINTEELIAQGWIDAAQIMPNLEIVFKLKNPLKFILSDLKKKERQADRTMNTEVDQNLISVADCLQGFFQPSKLELNCSKCEKGKHVETQYQIAESSPYLIVHFKRFMPRYTANGYEFVKNEERIVIDQKLSIANRVFTLEGIVNHFGNIDSGHYSYDRLMPASNSGSSQIRVLEYDDHKLKIHRYQKSRLESKDAYVVLYKCVSEGDTGTLEQNYQPNAKLPDS